MEKSQICDSLSPSLFRNKKVSSFHFAASFAKINKYVNDKIILFLAVNFLCDAMFLRAQLHPSIIRHFQRFLYTQALRAHLFC